jgi:hypothetical protein
MAVVAPVMPTPPQAADDNRHDVVPGLADEGDQSAFGQPSDSEDTTYLPAPVANGSSAWSRKDREERTPQVAAASDNGSWS